MIARRLISVALVWLCAVAGGLLLSSAPALAQREHVYNSSFGSEGTGDGQFSRPGALAVSEVGLSIGDVYVVDRGNERVEEFSATGVYIGQFNGGESPTGAFSWSRSGPYEDEAPEGAIAVDNSTNPLDPSAGDVYVMDRGHGVIDKFSGSGVYLGQVTGPSASSPFSPLLGVAVDANGSLWVQTDEGLEEFNDATVNEYVSELRLKYDLSGNFGSLRGVGLAFDSEGNIYIGHGRSGEEDVAAEFNSTGTLLANEVDGEPTTGIAVDRSSDDVYLANGTTVAAFSPSGSSVERFGSEQLSASAGVAVDSSTGTVYASDATSQVVEIFTAFVVPDVTPSSVSSLGETSATVGGIVNPDGLAVTSCVFEYGTSESYGQSEPCSTSPGSGSGPVAVSAELKGLERLTKYYLRLKVSNANGSNQGQDRTFLTPVPVALGEQSISDVSSSSAQFGALVDPGGSDTTFRFEYGTSASYGSSVPVPSGDLGAGTSSEPVSVRVEGLLPQTTYHVRIAATNLLGTVYGPDETFTTQAGGGTLALPDGRAWEMVSPPSKDGAGLVPFEEGVVEAAEDGSAITYLANGPLVENPAGNPSPLARTQALSRRGAGGGWSTEDIVSQHTTGSEGPPRGVEDLFFSADLSSALVESGSTLLSPEATEPTLYIRDNGTGSYRPLVTADNVPEGTKFGNTQSEGGLIAVTGTPDLSHVLFRSVVALTSNSDGKGGLYEWGDGRLTRVNVLPDGTATYAGSFGFKNENIRHVISNDGSRVFWSIRQAGDEDGLYMSDTVTGQTVRVDAPAPGVAQPPSASPCFQIASATGSKVFFLEVEPLTANSKLSSNTHNPECEEDEGEPRDLYVYDTETKTLTDLTGSEYLSGSELADVQPDVLGASEDGSVVYFVATGQLAEGAEAGKDNLYVESETGSAWSAPRLVAVLSNEDASTWDRSRNPAFENSTAGLASEVSPDGRFLTFMSDRSLTGYDNRDVSSGHPDEEVFLYGEATGHLTCVSCNPTGARPSGVFDEERRQLLSDYTYEVWQGHWLAADIPTWDDVAASGQNFLSTYQPRYLSDDGRLFFTSFDSLVPQDTNGKADVYEYEPEGVGSCRQSGGCVSLISSGTSSEESMFLDASGMGPGGEEAEDVFFLTNSRLTSQDYDTSYDVYDAHVCSQAVPCVSESVSPPECSSGDSCKAAPSPQPAIFGASSSATFSGAGNVVGSSSTPGVTPKSLTRAQKLAQASRACRKKKDKQRRAACERQARKRYGAKQSRKASATRKGDR